MNDNLSEILKRKRDEEAHAKKNTSEDVTTPKEPLHPYPPSRNELAGILSVIAVLVGLGWVLTNRYDWFQQNWFEGTANVQQVRTAKGITRIWMNDGTVWAASDEDAPLLASGDEIRYEHMPFETDPSAQSEAVSAAISTFGADLNLYSDVCYLVDKSRPGLPQFIAFQIVGDPKRTSCPAQ